MVGLCELLPVEQGSSSIGHCLFVIFSAQAAYNGLSDDHYPAPCRDNIMAPIFLFLERSKLMLGLCGGALRDSIAPASINLAEVSGSGVWLEPLELKDYLQCLDEAVDVLTGIDSLRRAAFVWVYLLGAKCIMCVYNQHSVAVSLVKQGLKSLIFSSEMSEMPTPLLLIRFEAMLLIGELYEQMGLVDRALPYLADARSSATALTPETACLVYNLHITRVWQRLNSSRFYEYLEIIKNPYAAEKIYVENASAVVRLKKLVVDMGQMIDSALIDASTQLDLTSLCAFRNLWWQFDFQPFVVGTYHTALSPLLRRRLRDFFEHCGKADSTLDTHVVGQLAVRIKDIFDVVRDVRRYMAVHSIYGNSNIFAPFFYAVSSCATSIAPNRDAVLPLPTSCAASPSQMTMSNCALLTMQSDDHKILTAVQEYLSSSIESIFDTNAVTIGRSENCSHQRNYAVIYSLVMEHTGKRVILSRFDSIFGTLSAIVPCYEHLNNTIKKWNSLMQLNEQQLKATLFAEDIKKWGTKDKKKWWDDRSSLDDSMNSFGEEMLADLGCWRCMLADTGAASGQISLTLANADAAILNSSLGSLLQAQVSAPAASGKSRSKKASEKTFMVTDSTPPRTVISWIRLLLCATDVQWLMLPLSVEECCSAALSILRPSASSATACPRVIKDIGDEDSTRNLVMSLIHSFEDLQNISQRCAVKETVNLDGNFPTFKFQTHVELSAHFAEMTVTELKSLLKGLSLPVTGKKAEMVERLSAHHAEIRSPAQSSLPTFGACTGSPRDAAAYTHLTHSILILDEDLQALPWENTPALRSRSCSRVPNISLLLALANTDLDRAGTGLDNYSEDSALYKFSAMIDKLTVSSAEKSVMLTDDMKMMSQEGSKPKFSRSASAGGKRDNESGKTILKPTKSEKSKPFSEKINSLESIDQRQSLCWFCIDPESNLPRTRETMSSFVLPLAERYGWPGFIGELISEDRVRYGFDTFFISDRE